MKQEIAELEKQIRYYSDIYYNGSPEQQETEGISDEEFDSLVAALRKLDPSNPALQEVGAPVSDARREKLVTPMLSQEKALTRQDSMKCLNRFPLTDVILEEKLDGCGLDCTYIDGQLVSAVTRGTWIEGTQCLEGAKQIQNLPKMFNPDGFERVVHVRGEVVIKDADFEQINKDLIEAGEQPFSNTRNLAAGTIKLEDMATIRARKLYYVAYEFFANADLYSMPNKKLYNEYDKQPSQTHAEKIAMLKRCGFTTPIIDRRETLSRKQQILDFCYDTLRAQATDKKLPYAIDGIVIKIDNQEIARSLGATQHHPRCSFAVKPEAEEAWVTVEKVDFTMSRLGTVTPTAVFKPVTLSGAEISRANVHNLNNMERFNVCKGTRLRIVRSGLVIPKIVGSDMHATFYKASDENTYTLRGKTYSDLDFKKEIASQGLKFSACSNPKGYYVYLPTLYKQDIPSTDPTTGAHLEVVELSKGGARVLRVSDTATNYFAIAKKCEHFLKSIRCLGWGEAILANYCFTASIKSVQDFIETMSPEKVKKNFTLTQISDQYAKKLSDSVKDAIQHIELIPAIKGLGISHAQASVDNVAYKLTSIDDLFDLTIWSQFVTDGVLSYIRKDLKEREQEIRDLFAILPVKFGIKKQEQASELLVNKTFVITGTLSKPRKEFEELIKANGGKFSGAISKSTSYLLCGEGGGSKRSKAEALGITIITEEEFMQMLK